MSSLIISSRRSAFWFMRATEFLTLSPLITPSWIASEYPFISATGVLRSWLIPIMNLDLRSFDSFKASLISSRFSARLEISSASLRLIAVSMGVSMSPAIIFSVALFSRITELSMIFKTCLKKKMKMNSMRKRVV